MRMTNYEATKATGILPTTATDFQLMEASNKSPAKSDFNLDAYLGKGAPVFDVAKGNSVNFTFDPAQGTLKQQAAQARSKILAPGTPQEKP